MVASYPGSVRVFTKKTDIVDTVYADHPNSLQDEVLALESTLGINPHLSTSPSASGTFNPISATYGTVAARLANIETGIVSDAHNQYVRKAGGEVIQTGSASTIGLRLRGSTNQAADLLQLLSDVGATVAAFSADGSLTVNNLTVNGTQTNVAGSATALDLGATTGIAAGTGANFGDKIQLYQSTYGFGMQANRMVVWLPANAGLAVRQKATSGYASSGTDAIVLFSDGTSSFAGLQSVAGGVDLSSSGTTLNMTGVSVGDKLGLYADTGFGMTDATHLSLFLNGSSRVFQIAPANTGTGANSASVTPGVQFTGSGIANFKSDARINNVPMPRGYQDDGRGTADRGPSNAEQMLGEETCTVNVVSGHNYRVTLTISLAGSNNQVAATLTLRDGTTTSGAALAFANTIVNITHGFGGMTKTFVWLIKGLSAGVHNLTPSITVYGSNTDQAYVVGGYTNFMLVEDIGGATQTAL